MATPAAQRSSHNTDTEYNLPNDATEHTRLEAQAAALSILMHDNPIHAPLRRPTRLLDIGCGTGAITHHLGTTYPSAAHVYGVDISPVPTHISRAEPTPGNVEFIVGDVKELVGTDERFEGGFDYVFCRLLVCGMTDWSEFVRDVVVGRLLRPGGWFEVQDLDYEWFLHGEPCSGGWEWLGYMEQGARMKRLDLHVGTNAAAYMREAGLVDVCVKSYGQPFGRWKVEEAPESGPIGELQARELPGLYEFLLPRMVEGLGLREGEVERLVGECKGCLGAEEGKEWMMHVTVGRRPLES